jgi:hypothetical protein
MTGGFAMNVGSPPRRADVNVSVVAVYVGVTRFGDRLDGGRQHGERTLKERRFDGCTRGLGAATDLPRDSARDLAAWSWLTCAARANARLRSRSSFEDGGDAWKVRGSNVKDFEPGGPGPEEMLIAKFDGAILSYFD